MMALSPLNSTCPSTSSLQCVFRSLAAQMVPLVLQVELVPEQAWCHSKQMQHLQLAKCPTRREKVNIVAGKAERTNLPQEGSTENHLQVLRTCVDDSVYGKLMLLVHKLSVSRRRKLNTKVNQNILVNGTAADEDKHTSEETYAKMSQDIFMMNYMDCDFFDVFLLTVQHQYQLADCKVMTIHTSQMNMTMGVRSL